MKKPKKQIEEPTELSKRSIKKKIKKNKKNEGSLGLTGLLQDPSGRNPKQIAVAEEPTKLTKKY